MSDDILESAEEAMALVELNWRQGWGVDNEFLARFVPDLVDELKAARAENKRLTKLLAVANAAESRS